MNSFMQGVQAPLQSFLVLPPDDPVYSGRSLPLEGMKASPESFDGDVME
jgi:hypothetical protein